MSSNSDNHAFAARARLAIRADHRKKHNHDILKKTGKTPLSDWPGVTRLDHQDITDDGPVCIVGAGVAGLYTAMILQSLGIPYKIFESSNKVGGEFT